MSLVYTARARISTSGGKRNSLYIGGRSDAKSFDLLERLNISHILNVTPSKEASIQAGVPNFFEKKNRFRYKRVSIYDAPTSAPQLLEAATDIVKFISNGLHHGSVLVHCQHGVSRSTTCALFYLIRKADMSLTDALQVIQRRRPQAQPIPAFMEVLEQYEKEHGTGDHGGPRKRASQIQFFSANDRKRPRVGSHTGHTGPPENSSERRKPATKETSFPPIKTSDINGPSLPPARVAKQIGPSLPPKQSREPIGPTSIGPSIPPNKNDGSTGSSLSPTKLSKSIGPSLPPKTKDKQIGPSLPSIESSK